MPDLPFQKHSQTSIDAATDMRGCAPTKRKQVLHSIANAGARGVTDDEVQVMLNMNPSTQRPRRIELVERGLVVDSGGKRRTRSGRFAVVWRAVEHNFGNTGSTDRKKNEDKHRDKL